MSKLFITQIPNILKSKSEELKKNYSKLLISNFIPYDDLIAFNGRDDLQRPIIKVFTTTSITILEQVFNNNLSEFMRAAIYSIQDYVDFSYENNIFGFCYLFIEDTYQLFDKYGDIVYNNTNNEYSRLIKYSYDSILDREKNDGSEIRSINLNQESLMLYAKETDSCVQSIMYYN